MIFTVTTEGRNELGMREICQRFADECWVPAHLDDEQKAAFVLDTFKRTVLQEMTLLEVSTRRS